MLALVIPGTAVLVALPIVAAASGWGFRYVVGLQDQDLAIREGAAVDQAKDELIDTLTRNHKALEDRVQLLEDRLVRSEDRAERLQAENVLKHAELEAMRVYAAPEGFKRLQTFVEAMIELSRDQLTRLTEIEERQATGIRALAEAIDLLREVAAAITHSEGTHPASSGS